MKTIPQQQESTETQQPDKTKEIATFVDFFSNKFSKIQNFSHIKAIPLYENKFRVNIFTKEEGFVTKFTIAFSYFTTIKGKSISTSPAIDFPNS